MMLIGRIRILSWRPSLMLDRMTHSERESCERSHHIFFALCCVVALLFPHKSSTLSQQFFVLIVFNKNGTAVLWKLFGSHHRCKLNFMATHAGRIPTDAGRPCSYSDYSKFPSTCVVERRAIFSETCTIAAGARAEASRADSWIVFTAFTARYHLEICTVEFLAGCFCRETVAAELHHSTNVLILDVWGCDSWRGDVLCCWERTMNNLYRENVSMWFCDGKFSSH